MSITVAAFLISYLIGSIPFGLIISKLLFHTDITQKGSGNIGATNITRTFGKKIGLLVFLLDASKGFFSAFICIALLPVGLAYLAALGGVLGHCYSLFMRFKGGKAISSNFGMILAFNPLLATIGLIAFVIFLQTSRYVSVASVSSSVLMTAFSLVSFKFWLTILLTCSSLLIIFKHMPNFKRIRLGTEPKIKSSGF